MCCEWVCTHTLVLMYWICDLFQKLVCVLCVSMHTHTLLSITEYVTHTILRKLEESISKVEVCVVCEHTQHTHTHCSQSLNMWHIQYKENRNLFQKLKCVCCVWAHTHACMQVCMHACTHICIHIHRYTSICVGFGLRFSFLTVSCEEFLDFPSSQWAVKSS